MPEINKIASFKITPGQFIDACSPIELKELILLLYSQKYQDIINPGSDILEISASQNTNQIDPA